MADTRAQHTPVGPGTEEADVPGMRCRGSCSGPNGPARCDGVALVLMPAARRSAAVITDIDANGCICVGPVLCRRAVCAAKLPDSGIGAASSSLLALKRLMCLICGGAVAAALA